MLDGRMKKEDQQRIKDKVFEGSGFYVTELSAASRIFPRASPSNLNAFAQDLIPGSTLVSMIFSGPLLGLLSQMQQNALHCRVGLPVKLVMKSSKTSFLNGPWALNDMWAKADLIMFLDDRIVPSILN